MLVKRGLAGCGRPGWPAAAERRPATGSRSAAGWPGRARERGRERPTRVERRGSKPRVKCHWSNATGQIPGVKCPWESTGGRIRGCRARRTPPSTQEVWAQFGPCLGRCLTRSLPLVKHHAPDTAGQRLVNTGQTPPGQIQVSQITRGI
jgi:hypothetical protein